MSVWPAAGSPFGKFFEEPIPHSFAKLDIHVSYTVCFVILLFVSYSTVSPLLCLLYTLRVLCRFALSRRGGLLFFLGHEQPNVVPNSAKIVTSLFIIFLNVSFFCYALYKFGTEFILDQKAHKKSVKDANARLTSRAATLKIVREEHPSLTHVVPIDTSSGNNTLVEKVDDPEEEEEEEDFNHETSRAHVQSRLTHTTSTHAKAHALHNEFHTHDMALQAEHAKRQQKQRRITQNRVKARLKIRKTKSLTKVPMFKDIPKEGIELILECTTYEKHSKDDILCKQGDVAVAFYIIVSGRCAVTVVHGGEHTRRVGTLKDLDYFGESCLFQGERKRNATVTAESEYVQVLLLSQANWERLLKSGALSSEIVTTVTEESERRQEVTRKIFIQQTTLPPSPVLQPPPPKTTSGGTL